MARKSTASRLSPEARALLDRHLREDRLTLDEIVNDLEEKYPDEDVPGRTSVWRERKAVQEIARHMREIDTASRALVSELGEDIEDKSGALLAQAVTTLVTKASFSALETASENGGKIDVDDALKLARAARGAQEARTLSLKERQLKKAAREELLAEQKNKLDTLVSKGGVSPETNAEIRRTLGIV